MFVLKKIPNLGSKKTTCEETGLEIELQVRENSCKIISSYDGQIDTVHDCTKEWLESFYLLLGEKP